MSKKVGIIFMVCWMLIGIGIMYACSWAIRDFAQLQHGPFCNDVYFWRMVIGVAGAIGYIVLTLMFVFHKDFRKEEKHD